MSDVLRDITTESPAPLKLRRGDVSDETWLFELFRLTMRDRIDAAWGWDELFQKQGFAVSLPAKGFQVIELDGRHAGAFFLKPPAATNAIGVKAHGADSVMTLEMILVAPEMQRQGLGRHMMRAIQQQASSQQLLIELRVLKSNPARHFYVAMGFVQTGTDAHSITMRWKP